LVSTPGLPAENDLRPDTSERRDSLSNGGSKKSHDANSSKKSSILKAAPSKSSRSLPSSANHSFESASRVSFTGDSPFHAQHSSSILGRFPFDELAETQGIDEVGSNKSAGSKSGTAKTVIIRRQSDISSTDFPSPPSSRRHSGNSQDEASGGVSEGGANGTLPATVLQEPSKLHDIRESPSLVPMSEADTDRLQNGPENAEDWTAIQHDGFDSEYMQSPAGEDPDSSNISSNTSLTGRPPSSKRTSWVSAISHNSTTTQSEMTIGPLAKSDKTFTQDREAFTQSTVPFSSEGSPDSSQDSDEGGVPIYHTALAARPLSPVLIHIDKGVGKQRLELAGEVSTPAEPSSVDGSLLDAPNPKHERQRTEIVGE
jgi:hypothetical protein